MAYAEYTKVPVDQTRAEIEKTLKRYGADRFAYFSSDMQAMIVFEAHQRRIQFNLPLPGDKVDKNGRLTRQKWRALGLCIKAKLEAVDSKIETFEEAFLAHVVMPDGKTVAEHTAERIEQAYSGGSMLPLLPAPGGKK